ncbi:unnamed protein product [Prunus armeniaca]
MIVDRLRVSLQMSVSRLGAEHQVLVLSPALLSLSYVPGTSRTVHQYSHASSSPCPGIQDLLQDRDVARDGIEVVLNGGTVIGGGVGAWLLMLQVAWQSSAAARSNCIKAVSGCKAPRGNCVTLATMRGCYEVLATAVPCGCSKVSIMDCNIEAAIPLVSLVSIMIDWNKVWKMDLEYA